MAVKMRLTRLGDKKAPFYRIVVADSRAARDAKYIDLIGTYNPLTSTDQVKIDAEKALTWLKNGAQPTDTVKALLKKAGVEAKKAEKKEKPAKKASTKTAAKPAAKTTTAAKKPAAKKTTTKSAKTEAAE